MPAKELISKEISFVAPTATAAEAREMMEEQNLNALPVVYDGRLAGLLQARHLDQAPDSTDSIARIELETRFVRDDATLFDLLAAFAATEADVMPVLTHDDRYVGSITAASTLHRLAMLTEAGTPGAIILLEMEPYDYALSDIARITEQNNARVINLFTFPDDESGLMRVMLKVDHEDATNIVRSFERYNYRVINHYHHAP